jgi:O-antigen ligase
MTKDKIWRTDHLFLHLALIASIFVIFLQLAPWPIDVSQLADGSLLQLPSLQNEGAEVAPWSGLTARPASSWAAFASTIPFFAVFLGTAYLAQKDRIRLAMLIVALGGFSLLIGFLQVSQGTGSDLRFYAITNPSEPVGFFANRNHFAALLYVTLVFTGVLLSGFGAYRPSALNTGHTVLLILTAMLLIGILSGIALARSRAGMMLTFVAIAGIFVLHWPSASKLGRSATSPIGSTPRILVAALVCGVLLAMQFGMHRAMSRFEADPFSDLRTSLSPATVALALENLPSGAGLGSFEQAYAVAEANADLFNGYANRAHNDWAEFLLETGLPGAIAGGLFLIWLAGRIASLWSEPRHESSTLAVMLTRGACLIVILLLIHSVVDYPLRTTALSSIFAVAAALLLPRPIFDADSLPGNPTPS